MHDMNNNHNAGNNADHNASHSHEKISEKILVTSALPYVNNVPHLGNLVCIISADVYAKFLRLMNKNVISVLGTDEHGTTAETKAIEEGLTPRQLCDKYHAIHTEIYKWFNCDFDCYGRTSSKENAEVTVDIFNKLHANGYIAQGAMEQLYCEHDKRFLADRFVEGTCPKCNYPNARGDQCESCGNLLNANELINPKCKLCKNTPIVKESNHLFMDLPKIEPTLRKWMDTVQSGWSDNAKTMTDAWMREGLRQRCITRDLKWGVKVPLDGYHDKVFYSWFDAPIGYIGITKECGEDWKDWWHDNKNVKLVQFMGKDNIPFHTILFPAFCIGAHDNYTLLRDISVNEFLNYENGQFSKSRNIGVFGDDAQSTGIPADVFRYYLMINRPERSDTEFSWDDFQKKNNAELVGNLGNLVNRVVVFLNRNYDSTIPESYLEEKDHALLDDIRNVEKKVANLIGTIDIKEALKEIMHIARLGNQYLQDNEPWKNPDKQRNATTLHVLANVVKDLSILTYPFMPLAAKSMQEQLNIENKKLNWNDLGKLTIHPGDKISNAQLIFKKIEDKDVKEFREKFSGKRKKSDAKIAKENDTKNNNKKGDEKSDRKITFDDLQLRVAKITEVKKHSNAEKLYVLKLDLGDEYRQIVTGMVPYYKEDELFNRNIVVIANLEPAVIRGVESNGMLLAAEDNGVVGLITTNGEPGDFVFIDSLGDAKLEHLKDLKQINVKEFASVKIYAKDKKVLHDHNGIPMPLQTMHGELSVERVENGNVR